MSDTSPTENTMQLAYSPASPFARKALILLHELELLDQVELCEPGTVTPVVKNEFISDVNPLGMIPVLITEAGTAVFDSPVICEYLNALANGNFIPQNTTERLHALQLQALADGIMDLAVAVRYETALRPEALRWQEWIDVQSTRILDAVALLNKQCSQFKTEWTIGEIAVISALGYLDFRFAEILPWHQSNTELASWFEQQSQRESVRATQPDS